MLKCRDVPQQSEKLLAGELGLRARASLRLHLFICHNCRRYLRQLRLLLKTLPGMADQRSASNDDIRRTMENLRDS